MKGAVSFDWEKERRGDGVRMGQVVYKDRRAFAHGEDSVFVEGGVGREDAFG